MHKRLETDLMSLAHSILKMKNKEDVFALKEKAKEIYEKLSLLAFVEEYVNTSAEISETKEELISKVEKALELKDIDIKVVPENQEIEVVEKVVHQLEEKPKKEVEVKVEEIVEQPFDELEELMFTPEMDKNEIAIEADSTEISDVVKAEENKILSLEEELQDIIPVDEIAELFETTAPSKSLNDKLSTNIQIGLNDRIAFLKNLFDGSQEDFNRVVSQLNTYNSEKEAKKFINKMVKPDYDWSSQEELETRFIEIVERKFS
ncbi:MAG: hypothetical protein AB8B78_02960 [Polaribacter sp.]